MARRFTAIKIHGEKVTLKWMTTHGPNNQIQKHEINNGAEAAPAMVDAMASLRPFATETAAEFTKGQRTQTTVKGITIAYDDDGRRKVTFQVSRKVKAGAMNSNTPAMLEKTDHEQKGTKLIDDDTMKNIETLIEQANKYVEGERAQTSLTEEL